MYVIRDVQKSDLPALKKLAQQLNTVNLPNDERELAEAIDQSIRSFDGRVRDPFKREYLFVLEDAKSGRAVGTSLIIAQHGTRDAPHNGLAADMVLISLRISEFTRGRPDPFGCDNLHQYRLNRLRCHEITVSGLTIEHGYSLLQSGGGIENQGTLTLVDSNVSGNVAAGEFGVDFGNSSLGPKPQPGSTLAWTSRLSKVRC